MDAPQQDEPLDVGVAGRSARREHERRAVRDAARAEAERAAVRERLGDGILGRVAAAIVVDDAPRRSTTAWSTGARGESIVGERLDGLRDRGIVALHDRRIPGSKANIDHIAITSTGVWVIDAKRHAGKRPSVVVDGAVLGFGGRRRLAIGGRRQDRLVEGVTKQVALVGAVIPEVPVRGMLCFVEADWPLIGGHFTIDGIRAVWPRRMLAELTAPGEPTVDVDAVARLLAAAFPAA